ncbi:hypothetical protein JCM8097_000988 [Rhodosporidiobolus ruineniae]
MLLSSTASSTGASLSARLAEPLASTAQLLDLLVPALAALSLFSDQPDLVSHHTSVQSILDPSRFVKRQLGLVQKVLVERVWPDWEAALEAEEGAGGPVVFERWFLPPPASSSFGGEVALSAYSVLSALLSSKSTANLRPRSLEIASSLLARLSQSFNIEQVYFATLANAPARMQEGSDDEDEDGADPASLARWELALKALVNVPTRVANALGAMQERQNVPAGRAGEGVPAELELETFFTTMTTSYLSLLWRLAADSSFSASPDALSSVLAALLSSSVFLPTALPALVPRLLPPATFPTPGEALLQRQRHIDLWRRTIRELSERDLARFLRAILLALEKDLSPALSSASDSQFQLARGAAFVLDALFGPLTPADSELWKVALSVLVERGASWNARLVPLIAVMWVGEEEKAKVALAEAAMAAWGAKEELRSASDSRRLFLTSVLLLSISAIPPLHPSIVALSRSPAFLNAVSTHLSLVAPLQRLLGMLVAEIVSARTVEPSGELKPLSFGDEIWGGNEQEKKVVRGLRETVEAFAASEGKKAEGWQDVLRRNYARDESASPPSRPAPKVDSTPLQPTSFEEPPAPPVKRPLISIIGEDDSDDEVLTPYPLPPGPSGPTLDALNSDDPALYHSAFPSQASATAGPAGGASHTRKRGRLRPPVYVPELVAYLKGTDPEGGKEEADGEAERVEVGLREGEALVRRKAGWGGELKENAVDLAFALMGLQDQYELVNFDELRQGILVALVVACPEEVAPAVIEQYFTPNYSIAQRHTLLASLALSARELAGLPIPPHPSKPAPPPAPSHPLFPSKQLPPAMHRRLLRAEQPSTLEVLSADLTRMALSGAREDAEQTVPGAAREKLLNVRRTARTSSSSFSSSQLSTSTKPTFTSLAAPVFILPLINRFWLYLRDTATSSLSFSSRAQSVGPYAGGPSQAVLLDPLLLSKFLATLSVLLHAARHSPAYLAVLVPETLGLVLAIKPAAPSPLQPEREELDDAELNRDAVLAAALELTLVALDGTVQLDGGRALMSESSVSGGSTLVVEVKDWAEEVFEAEERRGGEGGVGRAGRAAAGVLLRVEEIVGKWRGAVGW